MVAAIKNKIRPRQQRPARRGAIGLEDREILRCRDLIKAKRYEPSWRSHWDRSCDYSWPSCDMQRSRHGYRSCSCERICTIDRMNIDSPSGFFLQHVCSLENADLMFVTFFRCSRGGVERSMDCCQCLLQGKVHQSIGSKVISARWFTLGGSITGSRRTSFLCISEHVCNVDDCLHPPIPTFFAEDLLQ